MLRFMFIYITIQMFQLDQFIPSLFTKLDASNYRLKKLWSFMKNLRKDSTGVACLRENGILKTGVKDKDDIFNRQFESVYTWEQAGDPPSKGILYNLVPNKFCP